MNKFIGALLGREILHIGYLIFILILIGFVGKEAREEMDLGIYKILRTLMFKSNSIVFALLTIIISYTIDFYNYIKQGDGMKTSSLVFFNHKTVTIHLSILLGFLIIYIIQKYEIPAKQSLYYVSILFVMLKTISDYKSEK